jgi:hypothetical protein
MAFYKTFPRESDKSMYPKWVEVSLTEDEERGQEELARQQNIESIKQCLDDAEEIMKGRGLKHFQADMVSLAIALFEKRASHTVYYKEDKCREKFEKMNK